MPAREECNKYVVTDVPCFWLANHNHAEDVLTYTFLELSSCILLSDCITGHMYIHTCTGFCREVAANCNTEEEEYQNHLICIWPKLGKKKKKKKGLTEWRAAGMGTSKMMMMMRRIWRRSGYKDFFDSVTTLIQRIILLKNLQVSAILKKMDNHNKSVSSIWVRVGDWLMALKWPTPSVPKGPYYSM